MESATRAGRDTSHAGGYFAVSLYAVREFKAVQDVQPYLATHVVVGAKEPAVLDGPEGSASE